MATRTWYVDPAATGTGDGTSYTNAYTSLSACEAAKAADLVTATDNMIIYCRTSGANPVDSSAVNFDGSTTSATYDIKVTVEQANRAVGKVDATKYRVENAAGWGSVFQVTDLYVTVTGVQARNTAAGNGRRCFYSQATYVTYIGCIAYGEDDSDYGSNNSGGFTTLFDSAGAVLINCLAVDCASTGFLCQSGSDRFYNCVAVGNAGHGFTVQGYRTFVGANCYAGGNTGADCNDADGNTTFTLTTCASEDGTFGSTIAYTASGDAGTQFTSITGGEEDIHIAAASLLAGEGTDESGVFTLDIDGETISDWMIGADQPSAAPAGANYVPAIMHYARMRAA